MQDVPSPSAQCHCGVEMDVERAVFKGKEQIDRAKWEMYFSNVTLPCHPLHCKKERKKCEIEHPERKYTICGE